MTMASPPARTTGATIDRQPDADRVRLAANPLTSSTQMEALARDQDVTVRAALAMNPSITGAMTDLIASDRDERVRALLGRRLAAMMPSLPGQQLDVMQEQALTTLLTLVNDETVRVRSSIADVLKDMPGAPHELIMLLASDGAIPVADPVIRLSPLLTAEDLLALLAAAPTPATATAVARRPGLTAQVSDVIAQSADTSAVTALLNNESASIREATLDQLIARAATHTEWHQPLVRRPTLSSRGASALSEFVTASLLSQLAARPDLDPSIALDLHTRLKSRVEVPSPSEDTSATIQRAMIAARQMASREQLTEAAVLAVIRRGEARMCTAMLAVAGKLPADVVDRACTLRSAKGLVSVVWKAGFSVALAGPVQTLLARLPPEAILRETDANRFPLTPDEMRWHIEFLSKMSR